MSKVKLTKFDDIHKLQDHARTMISSGYTVLVATAACGHWIGYSAFKVVGEVEDRHLLTFTDNAKLYRVDPLSIYAIS